MQKTNKPGMTIRMIAADSSPPAVIVDTGAAAAMATVPGQPPGQRRARQPGA